ncbi:MAG: hypothetical protein IKN09_02460 [Clostridia bacterium]|nr:hypothetical protein [Clostridia bacterium]MBR4260879.1 hypothetical protein [Clostridia bacterium]
MATKKDNSKECITLRIMANLLKKGDIINPSAEDFIDYLENKMPNARTITEIAEKIKQISNPTQEELCLLKQLFQKYFSFDLSDLNEATYSYSPEEGKKHNEILLSSQFRIMDCTDIIHDFLDEYCMMLDGGLPAHKFILKYTEVVNGYTLVYSNKIFGNFRINTESCIANKSKFLSALKREKIAAALLESFGYISLDDTDKCSAKLKKEIFESISSTEPSITMNRNDSSRIAILQIGDINLSDDDTINQYLIMDIDIENLAANMYLSYGEIDIEKVNTSFEYYNNVANILLSRENLNKSAYIGTLNGTDIVRNEDLDFGPAICSSKEL